jgi:transcriptional regulator with XRE-family HTH domain
MRAKTPTAIGFRLRLEREEKGWTLRVLESRSKVSNTYLCQIERGHVGNPGIRSVAQIAVALGVRPGWLAWGETPKYPDSAAQPRACCEVPAT